MPIITSDGRDITQEEWRAVPGFKKYLITKDGDLWGRERRKLIHESENKKTGAFFYHVYGDNGRKTTRNFQSLVDLAFPELVVPKVEKPKATATIRKNVKRRHETWADIPGFSKYQINTDGTMRYKANKEIMKIKVDPETGAKTIVLPTTHNVDDLMVLTFGSQEQEAA